MRDLSLMTWKEIKEVNKNNSVVFIVMAPIEEHGLCLPLATDLIEGETWSRGSMKKLETNHQLECFYLLIHLPFSSHLCAGCDLEYFFSMETGMVGSLLLHRLSRSSGGCRFHYHILVYHRRCN